MEIKIQNVFAVFCLLVVRLLNVSGCALRFEIHSANDLALVNLKIQSLGSLQALQGLLGQSKIKVN